MSTEIDINDIHIPESDLLWEINENLKHIRKQLQAIKADQGQVRVQDIKMSLGAMYGFLFKWMFVTFTVSLAIWLIALVVSALFLGSLFTIPNLFP